MTGLTPYIIAKDESYKKTIFNIPIYQRLFEWDEEKIIQLLDDLYSSFKKEPNEPYYIGMLTAKSQDNDLVDGQQRFTVMTLIGLVLREYNSEWNNFLVVNEHARLHFSAREKDNCFLNSKINKLPIDENKINKRMEIGLQTITKWIRNVSKEKQDQNFNITIFSKFVFEHTTFFITTLPDSYEGKDLNKYFESMNSTGRNLESHEIKKIDCLKGLGDNPKLSKEQATKIWNIVSQMDKPLIRKKKKDNTEKDEELHKRFEDALKAIKQDNLEECCKNLNDIGQNKNENDLDKKENELQKISTIKPSPNKPEKHPRETSYHGMLTFSEFLLQVLLIQLGVDIETDISEISVNDFFDVQNLLMTFKDKTQKWTKDEWYQYFVNLLKYRLIFDYYVILIPNDEDGTFDLEFLDKKADYGNKTKLKQYQALLYAGSSSKSFYLWLNPYLKKLEALIQTPENISCESLLIFLKEKDNQRNKLPSVEDLNYQTSPIYWFRRLDYYIWEKNFSCNEKDQDPKIDKFRFRRGGRSIEHLYPQDEKEQVIKWNNPKNVHRFGNLALISSSFNSTQSNDSIEVKFARVKNQIDRSQLESIKLYLMYNLARQEDKNWTEELMLKHEAEMYKILQDSYRI